jgi:lysylphosphatidylglycerol synthetase-like protein (DUF2156 family)
VGAFFAALTRSLPPHLRELTLTPDWLYTIDCTLRYVYLVWFLAYFFLSNIGNQRRVSPNRHDIPYNILQSFCALMAAAALDLSAPGAGWTLRAFTSAMTYSNGAVFVLSLFGLLWYRATPPTEVNGLRLFGLVVSFVGVCLSFGHFDRRTSLILFSLAALLLWAALVQFIFKRLAIQPSEQAYWRAHNYWRADEQH